VVRERFPVRLESPQGGSRTIPYFSLLALSDLFSENLYCFLSLYLVSALFYIYLTLHFYYLFFFSSFHFLLISHLYIIIIFFSFLYIIFLCVITTLGETVEKDE